MKPVHSAGCECEADAFTMTELVVVLGCLALLALTVVPALAGGRDKSSRIQCANNLRQLHAASMQFANDNNGWLPWYKGNGPTNTMSGYWYSWYVWTGPANTRVPRSLEQTNGLLNNAGWLYGAGLIGDGRILFCPGNEGSTLSAEERYGPLLTSSQTGSVRSDYNYNPRVGDPGGTELRQFQFTSDLEPQKLFMVDHITLSPEREHQNERGWNVLLTDGAVHFSLLNEEAWLRVRWLSLQQYDNLNLEALHNLLEKPR